MITFYVLYIKLLVFVGCPVIWEFLGIMSHQIKSSHLSKEMDCTTLCNSFIVLFKIYIYMIF